MGRIPAKEVECYNMHVRDYVLNIEKELQTLKRLLSDVVDAWDKGYIVATMGEGKDILERAKEEVR